MTPDVAVVRTYFAKLGLEYEIADIYLALHADGPQTMSALARSSGVERTRLYRLIDQLMGSNLIEFETRHTRGIIKAAPIANLRTLITQKEQELRSLTDELELIEQVLARNSLSNAAIRVQLYHGPAGLRTLLWKLLDARSPILGYADHELGEVTGKAFQTRWDTEFSQRKLSIQLLSDQFVVPGICFVYNDTVLYVHWTDDGVFGTEIISKNMADAQRQLLTRLLPPAQSK